MARGSGVTGRAVLSGPVVIECPTQGRLLVARDAGGIGRLSQTVLRRQGVAVGALRRRGVREDEASARSVAGRALTAVGLAMLGFVTSTAGRGLHVVAAVAVGLRMACKVRLAFADDCRPRRCPPLQGGNIQNPCSAQVLGRHGMADVCVAILAGRLRCVFGVREARTVGLHRFVASQAALVRYFRRFGERERRRSEEMLPDLAQSHELVLETLHESAIDVTLNAVDVRVRPVRPRLMVRPHLVTAGAELGLVSGRGDAEGGRNDRARASCDRKCDKQPMLPERHPARHAQQHPFRLHGSVTGSRILLRSPISMSRPYVRHREPPGP